MCVGKLTNIGSDNGLSPGRRQAIIWTNAGILLIGPLGTNFSEILIKVFTFSFKKMHVKMSSGKWRPFCLGLNVLTWFSCSPVTQPYKISTVTKTVFQLAHFTMTPAVVAACTPRLSRAVTPTVTSSVVPFSEPGEQWWKARFTKQHYAMLPYDPGKTCKTNKICFAIKLMAVYGSFMAAGQMPSSIGT